MKCTLALFITAVVVSLTFGEAVEVAVITSTYNGSYAPKNAAVIWIQTSAGIHIKTIGLWANAQKQKLAVFGQVTRGSFDVDGLTGATRSSHGKISAVWDMTGQNGSRVADGYYMFRCEFAEDNNTSKNIAGMVLVDRASAGFNEGPESDYFFNFGATYYLGAVGSKTEFSLLKTAMPVSVTAGSNGLRIANLPAEYGLVNLSLLDANGRMLSSMKTGNSSVNWNVENLNKSLFLRVNAGGRNAVIPVSMSR